MSGEFVELGGEFADAFLEDAFVHGFDFDADVPAGVERPALCFDFVDCGDLA